MIRKRWLLHLPGFLLLALTACQTAPPALPSALPEAATATAATEPQASTPTPAPTPSPSLPNATETGLHSIAPENAGQVTELAKLGKGALLAAPVYSPDGQWLAVPTAAGIYLYDAVTLEEQGAIPKWTPFIAFSPDGKFLAVSGKGPVSLWDAAAGRLVAELAGSVDDVHWELTFSPDGKWLAASTPEREILVWSVAEGQPRFTFPGDRLQFSPDGALAVVTRYGEDRVDLYDVQTGDELNHFNARQAGFSPGGQLWLEDSESVRLVYVDRNLVSAPFHGVAPAFSADGGLMAVFDHQQIWLYDPVKGRRVQRLEGTYTNLDQLLFSADGQTLAAGVYTPKCPTCPEIEERRLVIWRAADGSIITEIIHPTVEIAYSADGSTLAATDMERVRILQAIDGAVTHQIEGFMGPVEGMVLAPDGKTLAAVHDSQPYTLRLWDLETLQVARTLSSRPDSGAATNAAVAFSPDGKYVAVRGDLWDLASGERLTGLEQAIGAKTSCWSSSVAFSPKGSTLATGCFEGQLDLWSVPEGAHLESIGEYSGWVDDLAYSPSGDALAAVYGVPDSLVQVWQMPEGKPGFQLTGAHFLRAAYAPDGQTLATIAANPEYEQYGRPGGFVKLWSASNGAELVQLEVQDAASVAFSPDSRILATGSLDGTLRLWEAAGGRLLLEAEGRYGSLQRLSFTLDGARLIAGSPDGTMTVWGLPAPASPEAAPPPEPWQTYTSARFGFSLEYPPGWQALEVPNANYPTEVPQVWFTATGFPPPNTGARADIVLMLLEQDPSQDWQADKFDNFISEAIRLGNREALKISGINKESLYEETAIITQVGEYFLLALPNGSPEAQQVFDRMLATLR